MRNDLFVVVGVAGFEPAAPWSQTRCANRTAPHPEYSADAEISNFFQRSRGFEAAALPISSGCANRTEFIRRRLTTPRIIRCQTLHPDIYRRGDARH